MNSPRKTLVVISALIGLLPLPACAYSGGPLEGKVLAEGTNQPIANAMVIVRWQGNSFGFAHSQTVCIHVESTTTDSEGRYRIPAWRAKTEPVGVHSIQALVTAHQPGYQQSNVLSEKGDIQYLKPSTQSRGERLGYLMRVLESTRCGATDKSERNLHQLYKTLFEEGSSIAVTEQEKDVVDTLRYWSTFVLFDPSRPSARDKKGRLINIEPVEQKK